jgi:hypothetical protein
MIMGGSATARRGTKPVRFMPPTTPMSGNQATLLTVNQPNERRRIIRTSGDRDLHHLQALRPVDT